MHYLTICCFIIYFVGYIIAKAKVVTYEGAQVWRTNLRSSEEVQVIQELSEKGAISIWFLSRQAVDYLVHAADQRKVVRVLEDHELEHSTVVNDLQRTLDEMKEEPRNWNEHTLRIGHRLSWQSYPTLEIINEYLEYLRKTYPSLCIVSTIGYSVERRPIQMVTVSNDPNNKNIMITSGIHAREWISITSALYLITTLVTTYNDLPKSMKAIKWRIIPVLNPNGYEYTHTYDRLWRKNRRRVNQKCVGVDLNRNFDFQWYIYGVTQNCCMCAIDFPGKAPFSEPETIAIRDYISKSGKLPEAFVDLHSYGQLIMYPWAWTSKHSKYHRVLDKIASKMSQAIIKASRRKYMFGDTHNLVYQATGIQMDWFHSVGVNFTFTFELRDSYYGENNLHEYQNWHRWGFLLPPQYIEPTGIDVVAAMQTLAEDVVEMASKEKATVQQKIERVKDKIAIGITIMNI